MKKDKPVIYACSGCSNVAQLANNIALRCDRESLAEMSCISGIGGNVPALVKQLRRAKEEQRAIIALDGCSLSCCYACLDQQGIEPNIHLELTRDLKLKKRHLEDFSPEETAGHFRTVTEQYLFVNS